MGTFKLGSSSLRRLEGVDDELVECVKRALSKSKYDMTVAWRGGLRTAEQQREIFDREKSKCDGYEIKSYHQTGLAVDVIPIGDIAAAYKNTRTLNHFARLMMSEWQLMLMEGSASGYMIWGGTFGRTGWDKPHYEIHREC